MPSSYKVGRQAVTNKARATFVADRRCSVEIFAGRDGQQPGITGSEIYWHIDKGQCSVATGIPMPIATSVPVLLERGEAIYVITDDFAIVGWSVIEYYEEG